MKKILISSLVGMLLLFIYQAMSWMILPTHKNFSKHTTSQTEVLDVLNKNMTEDGVYYVPMAPKEMSDDEKQKFMNGNIGKPWAIVNYHKSFNENMTSNMSIGLSIHLISLLLIGFILYAGKDSFQTFTIRFIVVFFIFLVVLMQSCIVDWNWWSTPFHYLIGDIIDIIVMGLLAAGWMAWYFGRGVKTSHGGIR